MARRNPKRKRKWRGNASAGTATHQEQLHFAERSKQKPDARVRGVETPKIKPSAVFSFLKETKGIVSWTARELANALKIPIREVNRILPVLELQGYVQQGAGADEWVTTQSGEIVSGSKFPRFKRQSVEQALKKLEEKISETNRDHTQPFKIVKAAAFGDFLSGRPQVQAADVGIQLERRESGTPNMRTSLKEERTFLQRLRPKGTLIHVKPYEEWMDERTNRSLTTR
jgi:DNA-binding transcriptional regulator YhcF (GntR family)